MTGSQWQPSIMKNRQNLSTQLLMSLPQNNPSLSSALKSDSNSFPNNGSLSM